MASAPSKTCPGVVLEDASLQDLWVPPCPRVLPQGCSQHLPTLAPIHSHPPLTYLMPQHPLQPVLPGSSQVDGQCGPAVLHHHHCLGQEVIGELHHHLQKKEEAMAISRVLALSRG